MLRVFLSVDLLRAGRKPVLALQPLNPMPEMRLYQYIQKEANQSKSRKIIYGNEDSPNDKQTDQTISNRRSLSVANLDE